MRIAIIGAGLSGLTAARKLQEQGLDVCLFDKGRGPGGRLSTRRHDARRFDHGAQYFTARDPRFQAFVREWIEKGHAQPWSGQIGKLDRGEMTRRREEPDRFVGVPGMSAITRHLAEELDVVSGARILSIERNASGWRLRDEEDVTYDGFETLFITTPPAQAVPLVASSAPRLAQQAEAVDMLPCWALMASFDECISCPLDGAFVHESPLSWIARNNSKPGRPNEESWVLHGSPEWSREHLEDRADAVAQALLHAFFEATATVPLTPTFLKAHRWRYSIAHEPLDVGCLWDDDIRLGVGGDWCRGSRVEGAFLSGLAMADRVIGKNEG